LAEAEALTSGFPKVKILSEFQERQELVSCDYLEEAHILQEEAG